jgi:hypothetical protein
MKKFMLIVLAIVSMSLAQMKYDTTLCQGCNPCSDSLYLVIKNQRAFYLYHTGSLSQEEKLYYNIRSRQCAGNQSKSLDNINNFNGRIFFGVITIIGGITAGTMTICDANGSDKINDGYGHSTTVNHKWVMGHTILFTLSITTIAAGIGILCSK